MSTQALIDVKNDLLMLDFVPARFLRQAETTVIPQSLTCWGHVAASAAAASGKI